jgi:peptidylprolyl isomerase
MSNQVRAGRRPGDDRVPTRAEKRKAWKEAAAKAAAARRRRRVIFGTAGSLAVVALLVALVVVVVRGAGDDAGDNAGSPGATGSTASQQDRTAEGFPPLPAGADPALKTKPAASAGTGELTALTVTPLITGTGPATKAGQQITVNYVGVSYRTGEEFDSSWTRSQPFDFTLGSGGVIQGWDQGLVGVTVGSRVQLDIPSNLAYGDNGQVPGPLRFIVDVLAAE